MLVLEIGLGHGDRRGRRRVEGRAGLQKADDLAAALAGPLNDRVEFALRRPAHFDEIWQGNSGHGGVAQRGHHVIAMAAKNESGDVFDRDLEFLG